MSIPPKISTMLDRFDYALSKIEDRVSPLVATPLTETISKSSYIDNAKRSLAYSHTINSLFYMFLRVNGISPTRHPIKGELSRVERYMKKAIEVSNKLEMEGDVDEKHLKCEERDCDKDEDKNQESSNISPRSICSSGKRHLSSTNIKKDSNLRSKSAKIDTLDGVKDKHAMFSTKKRKKKRKSKK